MSIFRRGRFFYLLARELARKYTRSLVGGFIVGLLSSLALGQLYPTIYAQYFAPVERIGVVGEFTPTTLPISIQRHLSFGLTSVTDDGIAQPSLAEYWEATDSGKTYTFHLRDDVYWHDGTPVVATDVNYNIRSVSFEAIDDYTLQVKLEEAFNPFPTLVSKPVLGDGLKGFGKYRVSKLRLQGDAVTYLRLTPVDPGTDVSLEYRFYTTEALAVLAYKLGDIDVIDEMSSPDQLKDWGVTTVDPVVNQSRIVAIFFNLRDQLLAERSVRHGLAYALPEFQEAPAYSPVSASSWAYYEEVKKFEYDLDQSRTLFRNAQIEPEEIELTITTFPQYVEVAQSIANAWQKIGINATVKVVNSLSEEFQILVSGQDIPPDPDQYPFWHSQSPTNITGYVNLKIDKLLEDARKLELEHSERKEMYTEFQRILVEDAPAIFLFFPKTYTIRRELS